MRICGAYPRSARDSEHALITEDELTPERVQQAEIEVERARAEIAAGRVSDLQIPAEGSQRIIEGYRLKKAYEDSPSEETRHAFCTWMNDHAFWLE